MEGALLRFGIQMEKADKSKEECTGHIVKVGN